VAHASGWRTGAYTALKSALHRFNHAIVHGAKTGALVHRPIVRRVALQKGKGVASVRSHIARKCAVKLAYDIRLKQTQHASQKARSGVLRRRTGPVSLLMTGS
jgi:hypothetical protein